MVARGRVMSQKHERTSSRFTFLFPVISNHNTLNARGYNLLTASHDRSVKIWDSTTLDSHQCATDGSCGFATFHGAMGRGNLCNTSWAAGLRI
jgi:hypothetical protein